MRKNKRKWICILMLALLFCISAAAVTETRVQAAQTKETTGFVKKKGKTYYYKNGKKQKGLKTIDGSKYYFSKVTGVMQKKVFKTVKGKKYYFGANGKAVRGLKTIKKKLYYFNTSCVMQKGWKTVNGVKYYFASNGKAYRNTTKKVGKIYARFDENGAYQITASYCMVNGRKMQVQYRTDPQVSDEILLAAILYAEAGGERQTALSATLDQETIRVYKGQLAVGYTILNRMASRSYPSTVKEIVYAQYQFEPARTGVLTALLKDQTSFVASRRGGTTRYVSLNPNSPKLARTAQWAVRLVRNSRKTHRAVPPRQSLSRQFARNVRLISGRRCSRPACQPCRGPRLRRARCQSDSRSRTRAQPCRANRCRETRTWSRRQR